MRGGIGRNLLWFATVMVVALVWSTWPEWLKLQQVLPDLTILLVVYFALMEGEERAMFTGFLGGVYQDVATNAVLGHHVVGHLVVGFTVGRISNRLLTEHPAIKVFLVFGAGLVDGLIFTVIGYVQHPDSRAIEQLITTVVPTAFYTSLLTPLAFLLLGWMFHSREAERGVA